MSPQLHAATVMAGNNNHTAQQHSNHILNQNISTFVQPYTNTQLPETLHSNIENSSNNEAMPIVSSSEEMSYKNFSTKEKCVTAEMTRVTTHGHISYTSNVSNTTNKQNKRKQTKYFHNKRQEGKQSFLDSYASMTNGSAHGSRPKVYSKATVTASGTSVSEDLTNRALSSEGKLNLTVYTQHM
jgi:hypothetical protein